MSVLAVMVTMPPECGCQPDPAAFGHERLCPLTGTRKLVVRVPQRSACWCDPPGMVGCDCDPPGDNKERTNR